MQINTTNPADPKPELPSSRPKRKRTRNTLIGIVLLALISAGALITLQPLIGHIHTRREEYADLKFAFQTNDLHEMKIVNSSYAHGGMQAPLYAHLHVQVPAGSLPKLLDENLAMKRFTKDSPEFEDRYLYVAVDQVSDLWRNPSYDIMTSEEYANPMYLAEKKLKWGAGYESKSIVIVERIEGGKADLLVKTLPYTYLRNEKVISAED